MAQTGRIRRRVSAPQLPAELNESIERCALAMGDVSRLKEEVHHLKRTGDGMAHFAAVLFELELAREGDLETRASLNQLAELLLIFWRDGSGDELSRLHPSLEMLWQSIAPMLVQFEQRQFERALNVCWDSRGDPQQLIEAMDGLQPEGNKRVEFARCLYHLELARQGVDPSRAEFARRVSLLAEAYQDAEFANDLINQDAGLLFLWGELIPYLDEFFEGLEEAAARAQEGTRKVKVPHLSEEPTPNEPMPALGETPEVPSFRTLTANAPIIEAEVAVEVEVEVDGPPPPPRPSADLEMAEIIEEADAPPPLPPVTPAHGLAALIEEAELFEEAPPPPPAFVEELSIEEAEAEPDEKTLAFWDYTFASLQLAPTEGLRSRMLSTDSRADRKRLTTWLDGLRSHEGVPEATAFAALVRLMLAGETKEKSLFGQPNPRRKEALQSAFSLLSPDPAAAGHVAVWFELDGAETREALNRGLELLMPFLAWCARNTADPLASESVSQYLET